MTGNSWTSSSLMIIASALLLSACVERAQFPVAAGYGPYPELPAPRQSLIPTLSAARAVGWPENLQPQSPPDITVNLFASDLQNPRWLYELPNGDILVAESNSPKGGMPGGLRGWVAGLMMSWSGSSEPSADRITLLRDSNGDGVADIRSVFLEDLHSPFGMALVDDQLYIANADALLVLPYQSGQLEIVATPRQLTDLRSGTLNYHWTKNLLASTDGRKLYLAIGSNSNVAEFGLEEEVGRAAIWEIDAATGEHRIFASGLRNPVGMAWMPETEQLWTVVNERDELGSDLVPDYLTSVVDGGFYGWPWSYFGDHVDERVQPSRQDMVARALVPDYALGNHTGSLGLSWAGESRLPARFHNGMIIGQRGSWNRRPYSGYKVIFVPFEAGRPVGDPIDLLTGFRDGRKAYGRPVGVLIDQQGDLLVADDVGNSVWRVTGGSLAGHWRLYPMSLSAHRQKLV